jgi:hypothetical protein
LNDPRIPYQELEFAAREDEIRLVERKADLARRGGGDERLVVELEGIAGVGKSWLLEHVHRTFAPRPEQGTPFVSGLAHLCAVQDPAAVVGALCASLAAQLKGKDKRAEALKGAGSLAECQEAIGELLSTYTPVLLLDSSEDAPEPLLSALEDELIHPLVRTGRVVFVIAGRRRLRWRRYEVRRRVEHRALGLLGDSGEKQEMQEMLDKLGVDPGLAAELGRYAFRHPLTTRAIVEALRGQGIQPSDLTSEVLRASEAFIADQIHDQVIAGYLFDGVAPELASLLWLACIPRKFDVTPLRALAVRFYPDRGYADRPSGFYLDTIRDMQDTRLVKWDSEWDGYALLPVLRQIIATNLYMRDPDTFRTWHGQAAEQYRAWIEQFPRGADGYLVEFAFHRAWHLYANGVDKEHASTEIAAECADLWQEVANTPDVQWDLAEMSEGLLNRIGADAELAGVFPQVYDSLSLQAKAAVRL